jgi:3-methyladenine DNA glycosylase AlkD
LLACFVADPGLMGIAEMEAWARDFDGWEICDQAATGVFDRTPYAWTLAGDWARRDDVWFKRAGFSMMAGLAIHDKRAADRAFEGLLPIVAAGAFDARDPVRKAVSWALRGIGKRNAVLHTAAVACAEGIRTMANKQAGGARGGSAEMRAARWVAADTLRELRAKGARVAD